MAWRLLLAGVPLLWLVGMILGRWGVARLRELPWLASTALSTCVLRETLGIPCPGCGATRSLELASRAEWSASLALHPFGVGFVVVGGALSVWVALAVVSGRDLGLQRPLRWLGHHLRWWWFAILVAVTWSWQLLVATL